MSYDSKNGAQPWGLQMRIKEELELKKIALAQARVKKKLSARKDCVFNANTKFLVHHTIENTPQNLENFDRRIANQILNFDKLSQHEWEIFLREYIIYSAVQSGLNDFELKFETSFVGTNEKGRVETNFVMLSAEYLLPADCLNALVDMLDTIDHELTHIADENQNVLTYRKFDNENGLLPRAFVPANFELLQDLLGFEDDRIIERLAHCVYYFTDWEVHARCVASMRLEKLAKILMAQTCENKFDSGVQEKRNAKNFAFCVKNRVQTAYEYSEKLQKYLDKAWPVVQKEFQGAVQVLKKTATTPMAEAQVQLILAFPVDMAGTLSEPELFTQEAVDDLFDFLIKNDCRNATAFYEIINIKQNAHSAQMLSKIYNHIAQKGPATLYSFHRAMLEAGKIVEGDFGKTAIHPKHLEKQMQIQREKRNNKEHI